MGEGGEPVGSQCPLLSTTRRLLPMLSGKEAIVTVITALLPRDFTLQLPGAVVFPLCGAGFVMSSKVTDLKLRL